MFFPDPLHLCIALGPLAMYLVVLGAIHLSSRPLLTTGGRDAAALAVGLAGLVAAGPMELFMIEGAAQFWGAWVWAMLLAAYALGVLLLILSMRPRLVVYNVGLDQLRPLVADAAARLDSETRWAGESLVMPQAGVQLYLETSGPFRCVQLVAAGARQNIDGWRRLESELRSALRKMRTARNWAGAGWLVLGLLIAAAVTWRLSSDPAAVTQALHEMLRL